MGRKNQIKQNKQTLKIEFAYDFISGPAGQIVLVVTVPRFCKTGTVALVNLRTLDTYPMVFHTQLDEENMEIDSPEVDKWYIIGPESNKRGVKLWIFSCPSVLTYVLGTQKNRLILSTHNICLGWEKGKLILGMLDY